MFGSFGMVSVLLFVSFFAFLSFFLFSQNVESDVSVGGNCPRVEGFSSSGFLVLPCMSLYLSVYKSHCFFTAVLTTWQIFSYLSYVSITRVKMRFAHHWGGACRIDGSHLGSKMWDPRPHSRQERDKDLQRPS